jgi:hypothetical protein
MKIWKKKKGNNVLSPNHWTHSYMIFSCRLSVEPFVPWNIFYSKLKFCNYESYPCLALQFLKIFLMSKLPPSEYNSWRFKELKKGRRNTYKHIISKTNRTRQTVVHEICTLKGIKHGSTLSSVEPLLKKCWTLPSSFPFNRFKHFSAQSFLPATFGSNTI